MYLPSQEISGLSRLDPVEVVERLMTNGVQITAEQFEFDSLVDDEDGVSLGVVASEPEPWVTIGGVVYSIKWQKLARTAMLIASHDGELTQYDLRRYGAYDVVHSTSSERDSALRIHRPRHVHTTTGWPVADSFPGATLVLGGTGAGKTHYISKTLGADIIVRYGEPMEDVDVRENVIGAETLAEVISLAATLGTHGNRIAVDSLRALVYSSGGAAGAGGVSVAVYTILTGLSNVFASVGTNIVIAVNPLADDVSKESALFTRFAASLAGALHIVNRQVVAEQHRLVTGRVINTGSGASPEPLLPESQTHEPIDMSGIEGNHIERVSSRLAGASYAIDDDHTTPEDSRYSRAPRSMSQF